MIAVLEKLQAKVFLDPSLHSVWRRAAQIFYKRPFLSQIDSNYVYLVTGFSVTFFLIMFIGLQISYLLYFNDLKPLIDEHNLGYSNLVYVWCEVISRWIFFPLYIYFALYAKYQTSLFDKDVRLKDPCVC